MNLTSALVSIISLGTALVATARPPLDNENNGHNGRRIGQLGGVSAGASAADCAKSMDIKLFSDSSAVKFHPDMKACKSGKAYVGSNAARNKHITLVPSRGNNVNAFHASVTNDDTGEVHSIGPDANGDMTVTERLQDDYGLELDPQDNMDPQDDMDPQERALLSSTSVGLRGTHHDDGRALQATSILNVLVPWTPGAECRNSGLSRGCALTPTTESNMRGTIDLAIAETNTAYTLSGVGIELALALAYYTNYDDSAGFSTSLNRLQSQSDGYMDDAHTHRETHNARKYASLHCILTL
jgi:hypothetical protein